ncbi:MULTISPECIES: diadenylate cyclase [unclassified Nocardioides]|uniref:diadenylate cyclase n=1 Tax=unclassified Nocardioides TaxID=2615069 RepID=UPI0009F11E08|nr:MULTISPECIES: diadenylate cyclase [unclassified Nocardioides]GAW51133.1 uncharacterized protein PD653B2_3472 [Nocardioides sp. PD653-B2]GAW57532.1 uncharacterized protein PD653_4977 [Nocardioides sp. PD653]
MRTISQFMWGFQPHFRSSLETFARRAFESIDFGAGPRAYLIGFATQPGLRFPVCFESEADPLAQISFADIDGLAERIYTDNPESELIDSYRPLHERRQQNLRDRARAEAVKVTLEAAAAGADRYFFVGMPGVVDSAYAVHPILAFPRGRWDAKPALATTVFDRFTVERSLQHALVTELLSKATSALRQQEPPEGLPFIGIDESEYANRAAQALTQSVVVLAGHAMQTQLHTALDAVASQPYEGRAGFGRLILAADGHPEVDVALRFLEKVPLDNARLLRKTLEMTGDGLYLLCDGEHVFGLGALPDSKAPATEFVDAGTSESTAADSETRLPDESIFEFDVLGQGAWELRHRDSPLLRVTNTRAGLPRPRLSEDDFKDLSTRLFPEASADDVSELWTLAETAARAEHGTMLVVHRAAAQEAVRLLPQAQRLEPTRLSARTLEAVTAIDGAVLVDPQANCHAVGVILDGTSVGAGDAARGARFNSAIRYQHAVGADCMVVIVSEDGMINVIPRLPRRIHPSAVERPLEQLEIALTRGPSYDDFFRAWTHLEALRFYLTDAQCARANAARETLEEDRAKPEPDAPPGLGRITHVSWTPFEPDPDMDDTYYLAEPESTPLLGEHD